jgi:hypothetical protein
MQLSAVTLARYIGFVETFDLNPRGKVFFPEILKALVERCHFQKFPREYSELDEQKGVDFLDGKWGEVTVDKVTIYRDGILIDTRSTTADSERILHEALSWAASEFGITYRPEMIKRRAYVSNLTFYSQTPLLTVLNPTLSRLSDRVGRAVSEIFRRDFEYETTGITVHYDLSLRQIPVAAFTIQRRLQTPFSENKYFSEAPLPTDLHWTLLQEFEAGLVKTAQTST